MSVHHGRIHRQLLDPEQELHRFQYTEGRAMSPVPRRSELAAAMVALVLLSIAGSISTYGVYNQEKDTMLFGFILIGVVFVWLCVKLL